MAYHLARAEEFLADGRREEASLELQNALDQSPAHLGVRNRLVEFAMAAGNFEVALKHAREAHRIHAGDATSALMLAKLIQDDSPNEAASLVAAVIGREPKNPAGYVARSDLALVQGRVQRALVDARRASELAPEDPATHFQQGRVMQAMIYSARIGEQPPMESVYKSALNSFERYIKTGGPRPWLAQIEQARIFAAWEGRAHAAGRLYRTAIDGMHAKASQWEQVIYASQAASYARAIKDDELLEWSLEKLVTIQPASSDSWSALVALHERRQSRSGEDVLTRWIAELPSDPEAHIAYAGYMIRQLRELDLALAYLEDKAQDPSIDPPTLYGALANTYLAARRPEEAELAIQQLEQRYPDHPRTILERAQLDLKAGKISAALDALRILVKEYENAGAYRLLARVELLTTDRRAAIDALERAIALSDTFAIYEHRTRARLLALEGDCKQASIGFVATSRRTSLTDEEILMLAKCRYAIGRPESGRQFLEQLLRKKIPLPAAVAEFARRASPAELDLAQSKLDFTLMRYPRNWEVVHERAWLDVRQSREHEALARLDGAIRMDPRGTPAHLHLLRAQIHAELNQNIAAVFGAKTAFERAPTLPGALELLVRLYIDADNPQLAIAALQEARRAGALNADRWALLGRLQYQQGNEGIALKTLERALAEGNDEPKLKNDVAFLLAKHGRKLKKALRIATEAREELDNNPNAIDTVGYVYLRSGKAEEALLHFREAVGESERPKPGFYYHMGLALLSLDRTAEATAALEKALSISSDFPEATNARRALDRARAGATPASS